MQKYHVGKRAKGVRDERGGRRHGRRPFGGRGGAGAGGAREGGGCGVGGAGGGTGGGRLEGKAALVTGASSGLGRATAIALGRAGSDVALVGRSRADMERAGGGVSKIG